MKIVICGGKGQLGRECEWVLRGRHEVIALGSHSLDITESSVVKEMLNHIKPDVVLNCAAYTRVDKCETERDLAWAVNVEGPRNLAMAAEIRKMKLIHISSDYVFDGKREVPKPYTEEDRPNPLSYYGKTKWAGEEAVREAMTDYLILRTSWLYGIWGSDFLKTMLKLASKSPEQEIKVVKDQFGSPTWCYRLALQISKLLEAGNRGTYHTTSEGHCTWYELASRFLGQMGVSATVIGCSTDQYPLPAVRPVNSILENRRLKQEGNQVMVHWQEDLDRFVSEFKKRLTNEIQEGDPC